MKLTLIRHGRTAWNEKGWVQGQADPPLNAKGKQQARELAEQMSEKISHYDAIFSSPMQRAFETAEIVRGSAEVSIDMDKRLVSRKLGKFSGMTLEAIEQEYPELYDLWIKGSPEFTPPGGESTAEVIKRTMDFLKDLKSRRQENDIILIVTHRESIGIIHFIIQGQMMVDPLRKIKNCIALDYEFDEISSTMDTIE